MNQELKSLRSKRCDGEETGQGRAGGSVSQDTGVKAGFRRQKRSLPL